MCQGFRQPSLLVQLGGSNLGCDQGGMDGICKESKAAPATFAFCPIVVIIYVGNSRGYALLPPAPKG